jgi:hypothetical protein
LPLLSAIWSVRRVGFGVVAAAYGARRGRGSWRPLIAIA